MSDYDDELYQSQLKALRSMRTQNERAMGPVVSEFTIGKLLPTKEQISRAAHKWCGEKARETFYDDIIYFQHNWWVLPGLKAYVEAEMVKPS